MKHFDLEDFSNKDIIYFSPHHDDMVFSNGGSIVNILKICKRLILVNVFTGSLWAPNLPGIKIKKNVSACRKEENQNYCKWLSIENIDLDFDDSSLRGYTDITELEEKATDDLISQPVNMTIEQIIKKISFDYCFCPLALGNHIDHWITLQSIITKVNLEKIIFYEDLPYAADYSQNSIDNPFKEKTKLLSPYYADITNSITQKIYDMNIYHSQIENGLINKIIEYAGQFKRFKFFERIWGMSFN